jgi:hypothetical protein
MNLKIDRKSALCGLAIGVIITLGIGAADSPSNAVGRYQVAGSLNYFLIIDTATGKVWTGNFPSNGSRGADADFFEPKTGK